MNHLWFWGCPRQRSKSFSAIKGYTSETVGLLYATLGRGRFGNERGSRIHKRKD